MASGIDSCRELLRKRRLNAKNFLEDPAKHLLMASVTIVLNALNHIACGLIKEAPGRAQNVMDHVRRCQETASELSGYVWTSLSQGIWRVLPVKWSETSLNERSVLELRARLCVSTRGFARAVRVPSLRARGRSFR